MQIFGHRFAGRFAIGARSESFCRHLVSGLHRGARLWQYRGIVRLLLTQVVVGIWIVLLC